MSGKTVNCPYCGNEMVHTEPHLYVRRNGVGVNLQCHYRCEKCRSGAPWADGAYKSDKEVIEAAYELAKNRVTE